MKTISEDQAVARGCRPLTMPYNVPYQQWMLDNVISDMERGHIDYMLVQQREGPEVWRKPSACHFPMPPTNQLSDYL